MAQAGEYKGKVPRLHRGKGFGCDEQATLFEGHINITKRIGSSAFCHPSPTWHCQLGLRLRNLKAIEGFERVSKVCYAPERSVEALPTRTASFHRRLLLPISELALPPRTSTAEFRSD